jgi:hypothetical protein
MAAFRCDPRHRYHGRSRHYALRSTRASAKSALAAWTLGDILELFGRFGMKDLIAAVAAFAERLAIRNLQISGQLRKKMLAAFHTFGEKTLLSATQIDELLQMCRVGLLESLRRQCRHQPCAILVRSADKFVRPLIR